MHEADEPCVVCDEQQTPDHRGQFDFTIGGEVYCEDDYDAAHEAWQETNDERRADR
jgi:hypothetical protein